MKSRLTKIFFILLLFPAYCFNQQIWNQSKGPMGGTIENLILHKNKNIYATLANQGIIKSSDQGLNWDKVNYGLTTTDVLSIHSHNNGYLFSGTVAEGIFRSTNDGDNWQNVKRIDDLPFSDNVRAFTSDVYGNVYAGAQHSGVFKSTNNGNTWNKVNIGLTTRNIETMSSTPNGYIFAGTMTGLFRSTNQGTSWVKLNIGIYSADISSVHVTKDGVIYVGTYGQGIKRSFDFGDNWQKISYGLSSISGEQYPVIYSITSDDKYQVYASSYLDGIFYLDKSEERWYKTNNNLVDKTVYSLIILPGNQIVAGTSRSGIFISETNEINWKESNQGIYATDIYDISNGPGGYIFAAVFGRGIYSSADYGQTWNPENSGLTTPYIFSLVSNSQGDLFAGTFDGQIAGVSYGYGVFKSTNDGISWAPMNNGLNASWVNKLAINPVNNDLYAATLNGNSVYKSSNNGSSWIPVIEDETANAFAFNSNGDVFAAIYNQGIYRSSNNGLEWTSVNSGLQNNFNLSISRPETTNNYYRRFSRIDKSVRTNQKISDSQQSDHTTLNVTALVVDGHGTIYAGSYGEIYSSSDNGDTWNLLVSNLESGWVTSLVFDAQSNFYAAIDGNVFKSSDYGITWTEYNEGLINYTEKLMLADNNQLFAGTRGGSVFKSVSSSALALISFNALLEGSIVKIKMEVETELLNVSISVERSFDNINWIKIGTIPQAKSGEYHFRTDASKNQNTLFRLVQNDGSQIKISKTISGEVETTLASDFKLEQNYPNPFNPTTTISYLVPTLSNSQNQLVILKVYDVLGNEIQTLVNETKSPGHYSVQFNAADYSSGVYFYTIVSGNFKETKKMILTK